jgi:hypothetical protein
MQKIDDWAKEIGGRFSSVLELKTVGEAVFARVRTDVVFDGILYRVPEDVAIPLAYRQWIDGGEIDRGQL